MVKDDLRLDPPQGLAEKGRLGIDDGDQAEFPEIDLVQHLDLDLHLPDELGVLVPDHGFRGDKNALRQGLRLVQDLPQRHRGGNGVRIGAAVDEDRE